MKQKFPWTTDSSSRWGPEMTDADRELYENRKWCLDNDFKIFVRPLGFSIAKCQIVVQRGGITTDGHESKIVNDVMVNSKTAVLDKVYRNQEEAFKDIPRVEKNLKLKYGK